MIEVKHLTFSYGKEPFIEDMNVSDKWLVYRQKRQT